MKVFFFNTDTQLPLAVILSYSLDLISGTIYLRSAINRLASFSRQYNVSSNMEIKTIKKSLVLSRERLNTALCRRLFRKAKTTTASKRRNLKRRYHIREKIGICHFPSGVIKRVHVSSCRVIVQTP